MKSRKIYIILFIILYAFVALVSGIHGFAFFGLANGPALAMMLAVAFEVGQAAVLFSILTDKSQQKRIMPWVLMTILTLVQVMGNVFNSYKYLIMNAGENLRFFKEPLFIWTQLPDAEANVILSYIQGAILPVIALLLTAMVTGFLNKKDEPTEEYEYVEEDGDEENNDIEIPIEAASVPEPKTYYFEKPEVEKDENTTKPDIKDDESTEGERTDESNANQTNTSETEGKESIDETENQPKDDEPVEPIKEEVRPIEDKSVESVKEAIKNGDLTGPIEEKSKPIEKSHFVNI